MAGALKNFMELIASHVRLPSGPQTRALLDSIDDDTKRWMNYERRIAALERKVAQMGQYIAGTEGMR